MGFAIRFIDMKDRGAPKEPGTCPCYFCEAERMLAGEEENALAAYHLLSGIGHPDRRFRAKAEAFAKSRQILAMIRARAEGAAPQDGGD